MFTQSNPESLKIHLTHTDFPGQLAGVAIVEGVEMEFRSFPPTSTTSQERWCFSVRKGEPDRDRGGNDIGGNRFFAHGDTPEAAVAAFLELHGVRRTHAALRELQELVRRLLPTAGA